MVIILFVGLVFAGGAPSLEGWSWTVARRDVLSWYQGEEHVCAFQIGDRSRYFTTTDAPSGSLLTVRGGAFQYDPGELGEESKSRKTSATYVLTGPTGSPLASRLIDLRREWASGGTPLLPDSAALCSPFRVGREVWTAALPRASKVERRFWLLLMREAAILRGHHFLEHEIMDGVSTTRAYRRCVNRGQCGDWLEMMRFLIPEKDPSSKYPPGFGV